VLSTTSQVALGLLQAVGLLIPVIFLSLRQLSGQTDSQYRNTIDSSLSSFDHPEVTEIDAAPRRIKLAWLTVALLSASGILSATTLLLQVLNSPLLVGVILSLILGLGSLAMIFYRIRSSFTIEVL